MVTKLQALGFEVEKNPTYLGYVELSNEVEGTISTGEEQVFRVAVLRNFTIEPLIPVLRGDFFLSGFVTDFFIGDFDTIASDAMNPSSQFYSFDPQLIILAQWFELLSPVISKSFIKLSSKELESEMTRMLQTCRAVLQSIRRNTNAPIIINNFPLPDKVTLGILDIHSTNSQKKWYSKFNQSLVEICSEINNSFCIDLAYLLANVGYNLGYNQRQWEISKAPFGPKLMLPLAKEYSKFLRALNGASKKCLVLDCDGTLWGGILGEDGTTGIKLGLSYPGTSYLNFQQQILNLYNRGIILAICSKNNEEDVLEVLDHHENMLLRRHHFACWQINWEDKASNIKKIASELNIGLDSLVFADDNEFECDWIKKQLPDVKTLHLSGDPALFQNILNSPGYFDSLSFSEEDKGKTEMYWNEKKRKSMIGTNSSYEDYLVELGLEAHIQKAQPQDLSRVAQLTQKTNQFNLTTIRYTEDDIKQLLGSGDTYIYTLKVSDKISNLGLIAVGIVKNDGNTAFIDSFLMSCRALGRGLENALLAFMANSAIEHGKINLIGRYVPSNKNIQTKDFYKKNSFELLETANDHVDYKFDLAVGNKWAYPEWITVNTN